MIIHGKSNTLFRRSRISTRIGRGRIGFFPTKAVLNLQKLIFGGSPLCEVLTHIAQLVESQAEGMLCTIWLPDEDETVGKVFYREPSHPEAPKLAPDSHGFIWIPDGGFQRAIAHKASADQTSIAAAVQRPIALRCIQEPVPAPAWRKKPSWFLIAEEDRMINPKTQHFMADRMGAHTQSHRLDHSPMYTEPNLVAGIILEAAAQTLLG